MLPQPFIYCVCLAVALSALSVVADDGSSVVSATPALGDGAWPAFRGTTGQGYATQASPPKTWSSDERITWQTEIPGKGWSSPVTIGNEIWLTTAIENTPDKGEKADLLKGDKQAKQKQIAKTISLRAICVNMASGELLHNIELFSVENPGPIHLLNSYASPTPVLQSGRLYCHFGTFGTTCLDTTTGKKIWERRFPSEHAVGPGSSPIVWKDLLILVCDGMESQYVMALDKATGDVAWKTDRPPMQGDNGDFHKAFSTPLIADWNGTSQLLVPGAQWFVSYDPQTGDMLWHINHGKGFSNVAAPVFSEGVAYLITGFTKPELWAIPVSSRGELDASKVLWEQKKQIPKKSSPQLVGKDIYLISDNGILSNIDADSGDIRWVKRLGGNFSASPILADGCLYFCNHEGKTTVVRCNSEKFEQVAENELEGQLMASPVAIGDSLYLRSDRHLFRID